MHRRMGKIEMDVFLRLKWMCYPFLFIGFLQAMRPYRTEEPCAKKICFTPCQMGGANKKPHFSIILDDRPVARVEMVSEHSDKKEGSIVISVSSFPVYSCIAFHMAKKKSGLRDFNFLYCPPQYSSKDEPHLPFIAESFFSMITSQFYSENHLVVMLPTVDHSSVESVLKEGIKKRIESFLNRCADITSKGVALDSLFYNPNKSLDSFDFPALCVKIPARRKGFVWSTFIDDHIERISLEGAKDGRYKD